MNASNSNQSALVLSGGGALGAAHIGAILALSEKGYNFNFLAGVSAGAIVCAFLACDYSPQECHQILLSTNLLRLAFDPGRKSHGFIRGEKIIGMFHQYFGTQKIEELSIPLRIGATNFQNGDRITIDSGLITDALRASISVPVVFTPYYHPLLELWLADGGLTQNFPLDIAVHEYKGNKIIGIDVATALDENFDFAAKRKSRSIKNATALALRSIRIFFRGQQTMLPHDDRIKIIRPKVAEYTAMDVFKLKELIAKGREAIESEVNI